MQCAWFWDNSHASALFGCYTRRSCLRGCMDHIRSWSSKFEQRYDLKEISTIFRDLFKPIVRNLSMFGVDCINRMLLYYLPQVWLSF